MTHEAGARPALPTKQGARRSEDTQTIALRARRASRPSTRSARSSRTRWVTARSRAVYDQWHLPPDAKSARAYKTRHRALRAAGIPGAWVRGKTLACSRGGLVAPAPRAPPASSSSNR